MITLTAWTYIIKTILKSKQSQKTISSNIKSKCLLSESKFFGAYQVDNNAVWENIVLKDEECKIELKNLNIHDVINLESLYHEREYHKMWLYYRSNYKKHKR